MTVSRPVVHERTETDVPMADWELPGDERMVCRARALARAVLADWRVADPETVDDIVLMVDELVTNAVVHGVGPIRLRMLLQPDQVACEVTDAGPITPRRAVLDSRRAQWAEAGRGLHLVEALASRCGVRRTGRGKAVWFTRRIDPLQDRNGH